MITKHCTLLFDLVNDDWTILAKGSHFDGVESISVEIYFPGERGNFTSTLDSSVPSTIPTIVYLQNTDECRSNAGYVHDFPPGWTTNRSSGPSLRYRGWKGKGNPSRVGKCRGHWWTRNKKMWNFLLADKKASDSSSSDCESERKMVHCNPCLENIFSCKNRCGGIGGSGSNRLENRGK